MLTQCRTSLFGLTQSLGLYHLDANSLVAKELEAYLAVLEPLEKRICTLAANAFVQSCKLEGLSIFEHRLGITVKPQVVPDNRRQAVLWRLAVDENSFSLQGLMQSIRSAGMEPEIVEDFAGERLRIFCKGYLSSYSSMEELCFALEQVLPAHLDWDLDAGILTWTMLDAASLSASALDALHFTWEFFDISGHELVAGSPRSYDPPIGEMQTV